MTNTALSDDDIVVETFQAIRVQDITEVDGVREFMAKQFPDVAADRRERCLVRLANAMAGADQDTAPRKRRGVQRG